MLATLEENRGIDIEQMAQKSEKRMLLKCLVIRPTLRLMMDREVIGGFVQMGRMNV